MADIERGVLQEAELLLHEADMALIEATSARSWMTRSEREQEARRLIAQVAALLRPAA